MRRCLYEQCQRFATFNFEGVSKRPAYCKQHAQPSMVDIRSKRCSHEACTRHPSFSVKGNKRPVYCKQHAEDGMVSLCSKRVCAHEACMKTPSFNVEGSKTAVYCKQHAEDGMVYVRIKRCSHEACTRHATVNVKGNKSPLYCKQHAEDGMIYVCSRRMCAHEACTRQPSFNVKGNKRPLYCKQHAEHGMVNVCSRRSSRQRCTTGRAMGSPTYVAATAQTKHNTGSLKGSVEYSDSSWEVGHNLKRSRREVYGKQPPRCLDHDHFKEEGSGHTVGTGPSKEDPHISSFVGLRSHLYDNDTVGTAAKRTGQVMQRAVPPLPGEQQSGYPIKTEMELNVLF